MKNILLFILSISCIPSISVYAQESSFKWWNPAHHEFHVVEGQAWPEETSSYSRLPVRAEEDVSKNVWGLSTQSAGLMIRFRSNAKEIKVRYGTKWDSRDGQQKNFGMNHMPATGVSGVDLYAMDSEGKELWWALQ